MAEPDHSAVGTAQFPKDWKVVTLGEVAEIVGGSTPSTVKQEYWNGDIPFVSPTDVTNLAGRNFLNSTEKRITKNGLLSISANVVPPGAVLVTSRASIGFVAINQMPVVTNQGFANLICKGDVHNIFVLYLIRFLRHELERLASGSTFREVSRRSLRKLTVPLPPLSEQEKMASILSTVDDAIQKTDEIIAKTQQLKKGLMQQLLTRGIGHTKFKQTEIGEIPEEWDIIKLGDVLTDCQYGLSVQLHESGRIPILRMNNFEDGLVVPSGLKYADINRELFDQFRLQKGDLLFNRTNSYDLVGKIGVFLLDGDYAFASYLIRLRVDPRRAEPLFINYHLNTDRSKNLLKSLATRGVSQTNINATNLKTISVPLPPLEEQRRIVSMISSTHDKVVKERRRMAELQKLKRGLMQVLLTGKVRVKVE